MPRAAASRHHSPEERGRLFEAVLRNGVGSVVPDNRSSRGRRAKARGFTCSRENSWCGETARPPCVLPTCGASARTHRTSRGAARERSTPPPSTGDPRFHPMAHRPRRDRAQQRGAGRRILRAHGTHCSGGGRRAPRTSIMVGRARCGPAPPRCRAGERAPDLCERRLTPRTLDARSRRHPHRGLVPCVTP